MQFFCDLQALEQYFRQMTPDTGPVDIDSSAEAVPALVAKIRTGFSDLINLEIADLMGGFLEQKGLN